MIDRIKQFLSEDVGEGDITSELLIHNEQAVAKIFARDGCVLAGIEEANKVFEYLDLTTQTNQFDGKKIPAGTEVLKVSGSAKSILLGERLALNFLMKMSGIATQTRELAELCKNVNPNVKISSTRKTTPGFRVFEKKAVTLGGGDSHRHGLFDAILIKENHLQIVGSVEEAVTKAKRGSFTKKIEIEVANLDQAQRAARSGADIVMLDNFKPEDAAAAYAAVKKINQSVVVEVSGGITPMNILSYAKAADVISLGWLTHSTKAANFNMDIVSTDKKPGGSIATPPRIMR